MQMHVPHVKKTETERGSLHMEGHTRRREEQLDPSLSPLLLLLASSFQQEGEQGEQPFSSSNAPAHSTRQ